MGRLELADLSDRPDVPRRWGITVRDLVIDQVRKHQLWQTSTIWKASTDGRVVCVDEFGPLNLQPRKGNPATGS